MTEIRLSPHPAAEAGTIGTTVPATTEPEPGELRCPYGHDSAIPPRLPALSFKACGHYFPVVASWNEFCVNCGARHAPFTIYWRGYEGRFGGRVNIPKNYCGYCGAKMVIMGR